MTFEKQCFIQPNEIVGIEVTCSNCGYRWTRTVDKWQNDSVSCANCQTIWFEHRGSGDLNTIKEFVASLKHLSELVKRSNELGLGFSLRLEVKCPPEK
jgi:hypothetical protein